MALMATGTLLICYAAWLLRALWRWRNAVEYRIATEKTKTELDILIPFRNEGDVLIELVRNLHHQISADPDIRLILIDDHSDNDTPARLIMEFGLDPNILFLHCDQDNHGKKAALRIGFRHCQGDWVVQLDADSRLGKTWLSKLRNLLSSDVDMALLPVRITPGTRWYSGLEYCEMLSLQAVTAGSANAGKPLLANGAGLAVIHSVMKEFLDSGLGTEYSSGDDQFLLEFVANGSSVVRWIPDAELMVKVGSAESWKDYISQRLRWAGKMKASTSGGAIGEGLLLTAFHLGFVSMGVWLAFVLPAIIVLLILPKILMDLVFLLAVGRFFGNTGRLPFFAIQSSILYPILQPMITLASILLKPKWKGRTVNQ